MKQHEHEDMISEEVVATGETDTQTQEGRSSHRREGGTGHHHHHHGCGHHGDGEEGHHGHCCGRHGVGEAHSGHGHCCGHATHEEATETGGRCPHRREDSDGTRRTHDDPKPGGRCPHRRADSDGTRRTHADVVNPVNEEDEAAENLIRWGAARAGVLALTPLVSGIALMANEVYMIGRLAKIYGVKLSDRAIMGFLGAFGARVVGKVALAMIPLPGLSVPVAISVTYGLGCVTRSWVKDGMPVDMQPYVEKFSDLKAEGEAKVEELADNVKKDEPLGDETKQFAAEAKEEMKETAGRGIGKAARVADKAVTDLLLLLGVSQAAIDDKKALAKGVLEVTKETTEELAAEWKEKVSEVAEEAKERAAKAKEQAQETAEDWKDRIDSKVDEIKDDSEDWKDRAKEKAADLKDRVKEKAADWKEQAQEHHVQFKERVQEKAEEFKRDAQAVEDAMSEAVDDVQADVKDAAAAAQDKAEDVAAEVADAVSDAKDKAEDVADEVADAVSDAKDKAEDVAQDVAKKLKS